ncbi:glycosyltransferase [Xanthobacter sediminis]|uniref:glycosyltransferase n=1 Tax=Xanthobacter sediminis TaxID=3119926 RepID=UPI003728D845
MGELFQTPKPSHGLDWTGERMIMGISGQVEVEHLHRYFLARQMCRGLDVLDIASGEGYGSALLSQAARSVVGVEVDTAAVEHARSAYAAANLRFEQGRAQAIPLEDQSVDCVVSFETIEHFYEQEQFLSEIRRVLRPGGFLLMSSPNRDIYSPFGLTPNPHHVRELTHDEFAALLSDNFRQVRLFGQRPLIGSIIVREGGASDTGLACFEKRDEDRIEADNGLGRVLYWIAIATDGDLPPLSDSFYFERGGLDDFLIELPRLRQQRYELEQKIGDLEQEGRRIEEIRATKEGEKRELDARVAELEAELYERQSKCERLAEEANSPHNPHVKALLAEIELRDSNYTQLATAKQQAEERFHLRIKALLAEIERKDGGYAQLAAEKQEAQGRFEQRLDELLHRVSGMDVELAKARRSPVRRLKSSRAYQAMREVERSIRWAVRGRKDATPQAALTDTSESSNPEPRPEPEARPAAPPSKESGADRYVRERYGEEYCPLYHDLFGVVDRFASDRAAFRVSEDCAQLLETAQRLAAALPTDKPDASIIIPVYENLHLTLTCIVSILATQTDRRFEILVGDDHSPDGSADVLSAIGGPVRVIRHEKNLGFLGNCNVTARSATGRHVVLLNNDTLVLPGWLSALLRVTEADPAVGMVGSKLLNGDGTLQEAGGIFWRDGSAWNFGRNQDPRLPEFNYLKDVDYISGASIALPREIWTAVGGFDALFSPAYCEDSDLAFRIRARGLRVVYQPLSEVFHHEGQSHGRDTGSGIKAYQVANQEKLLARWKETLEREHFANAVNVFEARDRSSGKPHIVVVDHYVPQKDRDAGSRTMYMYIKLLVDSGFQVTFWPDNLYQDPIYTKEYQQLGVEVIYGITYYQRFSDWLAERADKLDYVFLSRPHIAVNYLEALRRFPQVKQIYYGHDLHFMRMERELELTRDPALEPQIAEMRELEERVFSSCDVVLYPGHEEVGYVRQKAPHVQALQLPICVFSEDEFAVGERKIDAVAASKSSNLLFVGGFGHPPNLDGVIWLEREVLPLLRAANVPFHMTIVGSSAPDQVKALAGPDIDVRGWVTDDELASLYQAADAAVVPLRYGAGVKGKVIEAFTRGVPVVTTGTGVQGLPDLNHVALVADAPADFAAAIRSVLEDRSAAANRARAALAFSRDQHSIASVRRMLSQCIAELG